MLSSAARTTGVPSSAPIAPPKSARRPSGIAKKPGHSFNVDAAAAANAAPSSKALRYWRV
eukprot:CAMPEP_0204176336 /NCGR_PEP_ID=MMETSP0361-20130328/47524_1 /ASSEMBLY_ACC=CAM_ASM_000343 /TAXON_ID=268821 /ORGANISM="Scrippsiella Hangoei, Strain SHTV-5" /LENGTH=59 /DNA_ID=CAMNT_0051135121 /DNA_START=40 /DNA_END=216 /DNA_ORIENTATION=+